jgi:hypothetical protein
MRFLHKRQAPTTTPATAAVPAEEGCLHVTLAPQWAELNDMGVEAKATSWLCGACGTAFTPAEAEALRASEGERLKHVVGAD